MRDEKWVVEGAWWVGDVVMRTLGKGVGCCYRVTAEARSRGSSLDT